MATDEKPRPSAPFVRFLSSVKGHRVSRYGTATNARAPQQIGASRKTNAVGVGPHGIELTRPELAWDEEEIVALTEWEARRFRVEYDGHVARDELRERTPEEYDRWYEAAEAASVAEAEAAAAAEADRKAKAAEDAKKEADAKKKAPASPGARAAGDTGPSGR